jgi:hypothetical protein
MREITSDELPCLLLWSKKMGRNTSDIEIFDPSLGYTNFAISFLNGLNPIYVANPLCYVPDSGVNQLQ